MKRRNIGLVLLGASLILALYSPAQPQAKELEGNVSLSGAWALYPMALKWAEEFKKVHPKVQLDVQAGGAGKGIADALAGVVDFGMVSRAIHPAEVEKGAFAIAVCKDAVVPTISEKNPFLNQFLKAGVKKETFAAIWVSEAAKTWGDVLGTADKTSLHVYTRSDACGAAETWADFFGKRQEDLKGVGVYGDPGLAEAVRRDPLGLGYNNINYAYDAKTLKPIQGIVILPIDLDGNGKIDEAENFYQDRNAITKAIAAGIYPSPPARDLYLVSKGKPGKEILVEFLKWVLSDGQKYVPETGYINLSPQKLAEGLQNIGVR
jgi:phosphate transport system substrate-binding protein